MSELTGHKKERDNIDLELSKAYFGNAFGVKEPPKDAKSKKEEIKKKVQTGAPSGTDSEKKEPSENAEADSPHETRDAAETTIKEEKKPATVTDTEIETVHPARKTKGNGSNLKMALLSSLGIFFTITAALGFLAYRFVSTHEVRFGLYVSKADKPLKRLSDIPAPAWTPKGGGTLYGFEDSDQGWEIPTWAGQKADHVANGAERVLGASSQGNASMEITADFPGTMWTAAILEIQQYLDLSPYDGISADIYLPPECPKNLKARLILTVGEKWKFVEMTRPVKLVPGEWTKVYGDLSDGSREWKRIRVDAGFRNDVRKIAVRIESTRTPYSGPVYVDNIVLYAPEKSATK